LHKVVGDFFVLYFLGAVPALLQAICCQTLFSWAASLVALPPPEKNGFPPA
jgi:hypothetical protein